MGRRIPLLSQLDTKVKDTAGKMQPSLDTAASSDAPKQSDAGPDDSRTRSEWPLSPSSGSSYATAVIKGAGPSGLAAAISLVDAGFDGSHVLVVEKRPSRPEGQGRKNMVAIRPEGLRRLDEFKCLEYARQSSWITDLEDGRTFNEWNTHLEGGGIFEWPIRRYNSGMKVEQKDTGPTKHAKFDHKNGDVEEDDEGWIKVDEDVSHGDDAAQSTADIGTAPLPDIYHAPSIINEQVPCCFINLGHLEDSLIYAAQQRGIQIRYESSIELRKDDDDEPDTTEDNVRYRAILLDEHESTTTCGRTDLGCPDLIVCASGKGDSAIDSELEFRRLIGLKLEEENLPAAGCRKLNVGAEHEMESQLVSVFGIKTPAREMGKINHVVRKEDTGHPEQPVTEIQMRHAGATHCLVQLLRGMEAADIDEYITRRVNAQLGTTYVNVQDMRAQDVLVWGDPLVPVLVETATAPQYVYGSNVVLIGDVAMSCSPSSGIGADIGLTVDSRNIHELGRVVKELKAATIPTTTSTPEAMVDVNLQKGEQMAAKKKKALDAFNLEKARSAIIWSQGSRWFYLTSKEALEIMLKRVTDNPGSTAHKSLLSGDW